MKRSKCIIFLVTTLITSVVSATQGDVYIYPAQQQSAEQQERDRYECYVWGSGESGFDPAAEITVPQARVVRVAVNENPNQGATIAGTVIGAIAGAAINDRRGHGHGHGHAIAVGAGVGAIVGASIEQSGQRKVEAQARATADEIAQTRLDNAQRMADYRRAFSACLEGRGYVVR